MSTQKAFPNRQVKICQDTQSPPGSGDNGLPGGSEISSDRLRAHLDHPVVHLFERLYVKSAVFTFYKSLRLVVEKY